MESTYNRAEPGVLFVSNIHKVNPISYLGKCNATNPCGEIAGLGDITTVCLLGSVNLTQYVKKDRTFDYETYCEDVKTFSRMLDNVCDLTSNPLSSYQWAVENLRQFGMGINGLASALLMMGIKYNSLEAKDFVRKVCSLKENLTWQTSAELAAEKGKVPMFDERFFQTEYFLSDRITQETKDLIKKNGVRNCKTTTYPPNGNCVTGETKIRLADRNVNMLELFLENAVDVNRIGWTIPTENIFVKTTDGNKKIKGFYVNGNAKTWKIKTKSGRIIEATENHKLLIKTESGNIWKKICEFAPGDKILCIK